MILYDEDEGEGTEDSDSDLKEKNAKEPIFDSNGMEQVAAPEVKEPGATPGNCPEGGDIELQTIKSVVNGGVTMGAGDHSDGNENIENVHIFIFRFPICRWVITHISILCRAQNDPVEHEESKSSDLSQMYIETENYNDVENEDGGPMGTESAQTTVVDEEENQQEVDYENEVDAMDVVAVDLNIAVPVQEVGSEATETNENVNEGMALPVPLEKDASTSL